MSSRTNFLVAAAGFIVDHNSIVRSNGGRQIDWAHVGEQYKETPGTAPVVVTVGVAGASANDTTVPVAALSGLIPNGTVIDLGAKKFVRLTADAAAAATSLTVSAIPTALVSGDTGTYAGVKGYGKKTLKAGTVVGDLLGGGLVGPRVVSTNPAMGVLETDATENDPAAPLSGYGVIVGGYLYENLLPEASGSPAVLLTAMKTELNTAGASKGFLFTQYGDNRA